MTNPAKKILCFRLSISLALAVVFLTLGFCPLRNALSSIIDPAIPKSARVVPVYSKIIAHDDCALAVADKIIPQNEGRFHVNPLMFFVILFAAFIIGNSLFSELNSGGLKALHACISAMPIYLMNRVLLI